jgi:hypothetical protein
VDVGADEGPYLAAGPVVLPLIEAGFSIADIEAIYEAEDPRTLMSVLKEVRKRNEISRLLGKLDLAEAFNHAYIGSRPDKHGRNQATYSRWLRSIERQVAKLQGQTLHTLWDGLRRRSRKIGK